MKSSSQILKMLQQERKPPYMVMCIGSGLFYRYAQNNNMDLVVLSSNGRYRQMGLSSFVASLPFGNSNRLVYDFAVREVLPNNPAIPLVFGLYANDPTIQMEEFLDELKEKHIMGVCNLPTVNLVTAGRFRDALENGGISYDREVEAIALAHRKGLFTIGLVADEEQARQMLQAGSDVICVFLGTAKGGLLGANVEKPLIHAVEHAARIFQVIEQERPGTLKLVYGGPCRTPTAMSFFLSRTNTDGFMGGYLFERMLIEQPYNFNSVNELLVQWRSDANARRRPLDYVEYAQKKIHDEYAANLTLAGLAEDLHISAPYLSKLFKNSIGETFVSYLVGYRMDKAAELLKFTTLSIEHVGASVGYGDYAHFTKTFKKVKGTTPAQYRKRYREP